jgi:hypothetical protein
MRLAKSKKQILRLAALAQEDRMDGARGKEDVDAIVLGRTVEVRGFRPERMERGCRLGDEIKPHIVEARLLV